MFSDNKDFYPTPEHLFYKLMNGNRRINGRILEPSAGNGEMIKHIKNLAGRNSVQIDAIENDDRLVNQLMADGISVVWNDFLTYKTYKEYEYIIMNPPFSNGVDHVLKALELAENQLSECELYIIVNKETITNPYTNKRKELVGRLEHHNAKIRYESNGFVDAERKTNVEVALINVMVKGTDEGKSIYDAIPFFTGTDHIENELEGALSTFVKSNEMQEKLNDIERLILEYETACDLAKETYKAIRSKSQFMSYIDTVNKGDDLYSKLNLIVTSRFTSDDLNEELDRLRRGYWQLILDTDELRELLTNEALQELNKRMSLTEEMEINLTNISLLLSAIKENQTDMLTESVVSIFKKMTKHHMNQYSTNIHYYNGWKTNDAYKINKKVIIPIKYEFDNLFDFNTDYDRIHRGTRDYINDIVKAFQLLDSGVSNEFETISKQEFENDLLRFRMFKNGNIHIWFNDLKLLNKLNYFCGSHFNWIPSEKEQKTDKKAREYVVKEFGSDVELIAI